MLENIALFASVTLPLWNLPLIVRIVRRKSSDDISLIWAFGVWLWLLLMFPDGIMSDHLTWKLFNISNFSLFSAVFFTVLYYRVKKNGRDKDN